MGKEDVNTSGERSGDAGEHLGEDIAEGGASVEAVGVELLAARFAETEIVGLVGLVREVRSVDGSAGFCILCSHCLEDCISPALK